ncbi:S-layer homology domain-containing protein [uncultured Oscillibacter sp.]|uniref:S-layer homology domain-containing protein n=2 Tax=Oscillibacter TaxID=459786 RepID=UPI0026066488|nr:S-layer homology domain-containing protein [uncultured Oscillibacter sp.]
MKKRILSAFLVLCMMLTMIPTAALAAEDPGGGSGSDRVHTESNDGVVVDKTVNYDGDGNYSLTLEAYVTNEVTKGSKTTPLDIVLVLDVSGSMDDDLGESTWEYTPTGERRWSYSDIHDSRRTTYYFRDDDGNYHEVEAESDGSWGNRQYSIGYYTDSGFYREWNQLGTTSRNENTDLWTGILYTGREVTTSKMEAMQSAVNGFIDQVAENAAGADNDVTHRISIVKFADDSYADSVGNDRQDDYYAYNYTQIVKDFTTVDAAGVQQLTGAIEALEPAGATSVDYGLTLAQDVLDGQWRHDGGEWWVEDPTLTGARQDAKQVVVVFTDGEPNHGNDFDDDVAATAVNLAHDLKNNGVTVYTIGMFENADPDDIRDDFNKYMNGVSSNYPNATATNRFGQASWSSCDLGDRVMEGNYYFAAANAGELEDAFDTIADNVSTSKVAAGANTVLSDTLSEFFTFPEGLAGNSDAVTVQYAEVTGQDQYGEYTWGSLQTLDGVTPVVDAASRTITVDGFDYTAHAVTKTTNEDGTVTWSGGKLVLTFPIQPDVNGNWSDADTYATNDTGDHKAGLSGYMVDETPNQSLELTDSPEAPVETYQVLYVANADDADGTVTDPKYYITGGEATVLENGFTWTGHTFAGWNTKADGSGQTYQAEDIIDIENADVILYAQWKSSTASYRVEYYQQNLEDDSYTIVADDTLTPSGTVGETATAEIKEYEGFTYNAGLSNSSGTVTADNALVLRLYYDRNEYTVTYEYETGFDPDGNPIRVPGNAPDLPVTLTYKYGQVVAVAEEPTLEGYDFYGWYSDQPDIYSDMQDGTITIPAYDVVIKGAFTQHTAGTYTVTYDLNGGTISDGSPLQYSGLQMGDDTPTIPNPTKADDEYYSYTFTGWAPEFSDTVTGNVTYVAQYDRTPITYTVTYKLNGVTVGTEEYRVGEGVIVREQAENATPWETEDLEEGAIIGGGFTMPANDVVFTATTDGTVTPDECTYTVVYHYVDRDGREETETDPKDEPSAAGTPVSGLYDTDRTSYNSSTYIFDRAELNDVEIVGGETLQAGHNTIDVYYDIDELGPDDEPDGTPDKDQIVFTYVSADRSMGSVSLEKEVVTRDQTGMASPAEAVATAEEGYEFVKWTDDYYQSTDTNAGMEYLAGLPYDEDTTFTAYFQKAGEEPVNTISVIFLAENGTFSNGETTYTAIVEANADGEYRLAEGDILEATPDAGYGEPSWTHNYADCDAPEIGDQVEDWDLFVVTFHPAEVVPTQVTVTYAWAGDHPEGVELPDNETVPAGSDYTIQPPSDLQVSEEQGTWYFLGWYDATGIPYGGTILEIDSDTTLYGRWDFQATPEEPDPEPDPGDGRFMVIKEPDQTSVTVGDTITWTITIASMTDETLTLNVTDDLEGVTLTDTDGNAVTNPVVVEGWTYVTLYASYQTSLDDVNQKIVNTVVVTDTENPEEPPVEVPADPVEVKPYAITITPADIVIYTGGTGYSGVLDENDSLVSSTSQGLPEPGYHIDLPESVEDWLASHDVDLTQAANLANYLRFYYYDQETGAEIRRWDLMDQGVYSRDANGNVSRYVYSLSPNKIAGENEGVKVRLQFTDDGNIVTTDNIRMEEGVVSANYEMTIYDGGLNQSEIQAVFSVGGDTLVCSVDIGTGHLLVKSVTEERTTNEIVTSADTVDASQITAVDSGNVTYYVNDSEVTVDADRVQLLVDSVSNSTAFNAAMGADALAKVAATDNTLSNPRYEMAYLDLVDTQNGNTVVTLDDQQTLTIYWPMPADADEDGEFYLVHYTGMDRESTSGTDDLAGAAHTVEKIQATRDGDHLVFTAGSFSPFVLVYEKESSGGGGSTGGGGGGGGSRPTLNTEDHYSYIIGYSDGTLQPYGTITRGEVATIFFRLLTDDTREEYWSQVNDYTDCSSDLWCNNAISTLTNMGIIDGFSDGTFRPYAKITRAQFAKIAVGFFETTREDYQGYFTDVDINAWYTEYVEAAARVGLIEGFNDGTFRPNTNITRAQACVIVNRALGRNPDEDRLLDEDEMITWPDNNPDDWFYADMQEATNSHDYTWVTVSGDKVEKWTEKLEQRDWAALEHAWSTAHSAPGGEVTK